MARRRSRFLIQQQIALLIFALIALGIVAYLSWLTLAAQDAGEFVEGEHYQVIENPRRIREGTIEVIEFFSYGCVHCYNFDPIAKEWAEQQADEVDFSQMPVLANDLWRLLGQNYYTLETLGTLPDFHTAYFRALHTGGVTFRTVDDLAEFYERSGGDREAYLAAFNSPAVTAKLSRADQMARRMRIASVPTLVVQGKYVVRTTALVGPMRMLDVVDYLIGKVRDESRDEPVTG